MKKFKSFIYAVILISIPFLGDAGNVCTTSSDPDNNKYFCRMDKNEIDRCYLDGSGTACSGNAHTPDPISIAP